MCSPIPLCVVFFFFNDTATTEIYTLSLHDALPISFLYRTGVTVSHHRVSRAQGTPGVPAKIGEGSDRKSTRLNSSHGYISYAVFCLKKKKRELQHVDVANKFSECLSPALSTRAMGR